MEAGFLEDWSDIMHNKSTCTIISWNIHGAKTKLESPHVIQFLHKFDIICLHEIKTPLTIHLPGYVAYRGTGENMHRGGSAVLIKNALARHISQIRTPTPECIIMNFKHLPDTTLATCYIPPSDSQYHSWAPVAEVQEEMKRNPHRNIIVIGDLNARFGESRRNFLTEKDLPNEAYYSDVIDKVKNPNSNARYIYSALSKLVLVNGLTYAEQKYPADLTYHQKKNWISELDCCLVSPEILPNISNFEVHQNIQLPSDHAPISLHLSPEATFHSDSHTLETVLERSHALGSHHHIGQDSSKNSKKPIRMADIDCEKLSVALTALTPPTLDNTAINSTAEELNSSLYHCAAMSRKEETEQHRNSTLQRRWKDLIEGNDPKALWKAINWNGCLKDDHSDESPNDDAFQSHFEDLLNPPDILPLEVPENATIYLPITDDPILPEEVEAALQSLKRNKSGGPSGIPPGLLKHLPANWVTYLAGFFSQILYSRCYPQCWTFTKLVTIFKKGAKTSCDNYRGISLMDSLAKTYDTILNKRLSLWFKPDREQAGAQKGRGCLEHLLSLRLLIDYAHHKKKKLYAIFVDFSKAYDRVPRDIMLQRMAVLGCGATMIGAIAAAYYNTQMVLRTAVITAKIGVRQGSPTSCFLFTLLVNQLIRDLKEQCPPDGFLQELHCLMLMDDTVLFATSRESALQKIRVLKSFCQSSGMVINQGKTKFMVISGTDEDYLPLTVGEWSIANCKKYTYLGAVITQDGNLVSSVKAQCETKMAHTIKFDAFIRKNPDMPFTAKKKVFDAALMSAVLYSCETWLSPAACKIAEPMYASCVKTLLGVRKTTATDLCLIEAGLPSLQKHVKSLQKKALEKLMTNSLPLRDDPFALAFRLARDARCPIARYIDTLAAYIPDEDTTALHARVQASTRTKFATYAHMMNPSLEVHAMYSSNTVIERQRILASKIRLSSHNLAIEKGRWARLPREQRLCQCGAIQDELHMVSSCPLTEPVRVKYPDMNFTLPEFFIHPINIMLPVFYELFVDFC